MVKTETTKTIKYAILITFSAITVCAFAGILFYLILFNNAKGVLLNKLALIKPGISITEIKNELGDPMYEIGQFDKILSLGSIKNKQFCKEKKLYWFYASTPPCGVIEIYTDMNDFVIFSTWKGL